MNDVFRLKGKLKRESFGKGFSGISLHGKNDLKTDHIRSLLESLERVSQEYANNTILDGALIALTYVDVVSKSRRVQAFFKVPRGKDPDSFIVGAKIIGGDYPQHVITYFVTKSVLNNLTDYASRILAAVKGKDFITKDDVDSLMAKANYPFADTNLPCRYVAKFFVDCSNVQSIDIPQAKLNSDGPKLITIFNANYKITELLQKLNIPFGYGDIWGEYSAVLSEEQYNSLVNEAGYFIAMAELHDKENLIQDTAEETASFGRTIPSPSNEPIIGVIDTSYDEKVYFHQWVKSNDEYLVSKPPSIEDKKHGTEICSILVDGPSLNPSLDDHCGRFRVRLFPVASAGKSSWINIAKSVEEIVDKNQDIKVWNLSLGSNLEVDENFISPMGSILDKLQVKHPGILFIVAGTNIPPKQAKTGMRMRVGSPADSINSLVFNSVNFDGEPASYSRMGPVLSFFRKPDVSYYGGDEDGKIKVMASSTYETEGCGTSFAAPWIARKACFMMEIMGFSREETKALLIDSTLSFEKTESNYKYLGYGVVPKTIEEVVQAKNDEIRFIIKDTSDSYYTFSYNLPVPVIDNSFPFKARIVMAATLKCDRNKGVDYTCEELGLSFGRMKKGKITTINGDKQEDTDSVTNEETARSLFRKWDNVKVINEVLTKKRVPVKVLDENGLWGVRVSSKLRNDSHSPERDTKFAVVVTLKEIYGQNRSAAFESLCISRGWIVERINVENRIEVYNEALAEIEWK